jgi:hypothetical protein
MRISKRAFVYVAAGLIAPLLWTPLESYLFVLLPPPSSRLVFRVMQALVGLVSALVLVLPLVFALRPDSLRLASLFIAAFALSVIVGHIAFGGPPEQLLLLLALPDTWTFLIGCVGIVWWASSRKAMHNAA